MIALAGLLVLVAVALLVGGLSGGDTVLLWSSVGVSGLAAAVLTVQTVRRNRAVAARAAEPAVAEAVVADKPVVAGKPAVVVEAPVVEAPVVERPVVGQPVVVGETPVPRRTATPRATSDGEPPEEQPEVTDVLLVIDLTDEVVVVDEHPRYHLAGCSQTAGAEEIPLPLREAREDGFTACGVCCPDQHVAAAERSRRAAAKSRTA